MFKDNFFLTKLEIENYGFFYTITLLQLSLSYSEIFHHYDYCDSHQVTLGGKLLIA